MTDFTITETAPGVFDVAATGVGITIVPYVPPVVIDPPPVDPPPPSVNVAFTTTITEPGLIVVKDVSTNVPVGSVGTVKYGVGSVGGSIRIGATASYKYAAQGTYTVTLTLKGMDGTLYSASGTVVFDGAAHATSSDPGTTITPPGAAPPAGGGGSPAPPPIPPPPSVPPPTSDAGAGPHAVKLTVVDGAGRPWSAQTNVGDDPTTEQAIYMSLTDADGVAHPGLTAWFYADGVEVGVCRFDCGYQYLGCKSIAVNYDGAAVAVPLSSRADGTFDFFRGTMNPVIRYGVQAPYDASKIDRSLMPSYAFSETQAPFVDGSQASYTWNGLGTATSPGMGQGGDRPDLGYFPTWDLGFILQPNDTTWAIARRAADFCGVWGNIYFCVPETGKFIDANVYTNTTTLPKSQVYTYPNNSMATYAGDYVGDVLTPARGFPKSASNTTNPNVPNGSHLTNYAFLAAMVTGTVRDKDHCGFWANWPLLEINPATTQKTGTVNTVQRRAAWTTRSLFLAAEGLSSDPAYFKGWLDKNLAVFNAWPKNQWGLFDLDASYPREGTGVPDTGGYKGMAMWMQDYLAIVLDAVAYKLPEWKPFAQYIGGIKVAYAAKNYNLMCTTPFVTCRDPSGSIMTDFDDMVNKSLVYNELPYFTTDEATAMVGAATVQDAYNVLVAHNTRVGYTWYGKCANGIADFYGYLGSIGGHPGTHYAATIAAANAGTPNIGPALTYVQNVPTPMDTSKDQRFHLVLRAA